MISECIDVLKGQFAQLDWVQPDRGVQAVWAATTEQLLPPDWTEFQQGWIHEACWLTYQAVDGGFFWMLSWVEGL